jgi:crotonobetainyl-CoA:carnitine CoA-transferase CaiB-like acyl-CoA transferase
MTGLRVIELAHERISYAGKLFADMGADVVLVEPPGGEKSRTYPPFLDDAPENGHSLYFWHYNTGKRSVTLDLETEGGRVGFARLVAGADVVLETDQPSADGTTRLSRLGIDYKDIGEANTKLIWVSMTPFGRSGPRAADPATDLTLIAGSGMAWMCGYDDHSLPPVRGGGNQGYQTGCHYAVMSALTALLYRDVSGEGQYIDVNMNAAGNVTTEAGSYTWLVANETVQRQTGRHAGVNPSMPSQVICADGRYVNTGIPPRRPDEFRRMHEWLISLGVQDEFPLTPFLELGAQRERIDLSMIATDPEVAEIFGAGRECVNFIASRISAADFFSGAQDRGFQVGIIYAPEEVFSDRHFIARGFPTEVEHPELERSFTYPGAPYRFLGSPCKIRRRAPLLGEHTSEVLAELG